MAVLSLDAMSLEDVVDSPLLVCGAVALGLVVVSLALSGGSGKRRSLRDLVRANILSLKPYRCARDDYDSGVLLDANENAFGPPLPSRKNTLELERYPSPYLWELKEKIAAFRQVRKENIFLGVGSDEAIDLVIRIFCEPRKDSILITPPTYGMYKVCAKVNDVNVQIAPLKPTFELDIPAMLRACDATTKVMFVCSPGNPTAKAISHAQVEELCESGFDGIIVLDEAYVDFSTEGSACKLLDRYSNLLIMQTMSKAFGLAGIRLGMAFGSPQIIQIFNPVKAPYSINKLTEEMAMSVFSDLRPFFRKMEEIKAQREVVMDALRRMDGIVTLVHPSDTNFILFQIPVHAKEVYKTMAEQGIVVRYRGDQTHCLDCIRATVGTPEENRQFLALLPKVYAEVVRRAGGK